ncbi:hypothetical protein ElyMa_004284100 [Elysia marginata]|uniref:Secreted protein n=1 Tax=Elysia marginata TaxID=1093978 RepID=A0AAV4GWY9_9GAST|nr:hypothetical protein ElyMa_004284100 [Elysia marginata]
MFSLVFSLVSCWFTRHVTSPRNLVWECLGYVSTLRSGELRPWPWPAGQSRVRPKFEITPRTSSSSQVRRLYVFAHCAMASQTLSHSQSMRLRDVMARKH